MLSSSCATLKNLDARSLSVGGLGEDERIEVKFETRGCRSHCRFSIVIYGGAKPTAAIHGERVAVRSDVEAPPFCNVDGTLELSPGLIGRLDQAIQRYRELPNWDESCSDRTDIHLRWSTRKGEADERYVDDPCRNHVDAFWLISEQVAPHETAPKPTDADRPANRGG